MIIVTYVTFCENYLLFP